jgi:hypothetical protein
MSRSILFACLASLGGIAIAAAVLASARHPGNPLVVLVAAGALLFLVGAGVHDLVATRADCRDGIVTCVAGPARFAPTNHHWVLEIGKHADKTRFRNPMPPWMVLEGRRYRIYFVPRTRNVVAIEAGS